MPQTTLRPSEDIVTAMLKVSANIQNGLALQQWLGRLSAKANGLTFDPRMVRVIGRYSHVESRCNYARRETGDLAYFLYGGPWPKPGSGKPFRFNKASYLDPRYGNNSNADVYKFRGLGWLQTTWGDNYRAIYEWAKDVKRYATFVSAFKELGYDFEAAMRTMQEHITHKGAATGPGGSLPDTDLFCQAVTLTSFLWYYDACMRYFSSKPYAEWPAYVGTFIHTGGKTGKYSGLADRLALYSKVSF